MFETEVVFHNGWRWVVAVAVAVAESVSRVKRDFYRNALRVRATEFEAAANDSSHCHQTTII